MTITLNGSDLTVTPLASRPLHCRGRRHGETVALLPGSTARMRQARAVVPEVLEGGEPVTGGDLALRPG